MLVELQGCSKPYAWGSRTAIPDLFGWSPSPEPLAELWLGAHPAGPATVQVDGAAVPLDVLLATSPELRCGKDGLPFLLKVLAAEQALSLQVHPDAQQAAAGFASEEEAGVPRDAPHRRYRDANPKAELVVALGPFRALAGVRDPADTLAVVDDLDIPELDAIIAPLQEARSADGVREVLRRLLTLPTTAARQLVAAVAARAPALVGAPDERTARYADLVAELAAHHPGDTGIVASVLLHDVALAAGEALYQPTGSLHAYVSGLAVELMVSSDNVLRCGLTAKHIDVDELLAVWDPSPSEPVRPRLTGPMSSWAPEEGGFALHRLSPAGGSAHPDVEGPAVLLTTHGSVHIEAAGVSRELAAGQAVLAPSAGGIGVSGWGTCFMASCP